MKVRGADVSVKPGAEAPGSRQEKRSKPAKRAAAELFGGMLSGTAVTCFAGSIDLLVLDLGLTPQALRRRPLRGLKTGCCVCPFKAGFEEEIQVTSGPRRIVGLFARPSVRILFPFSDATKWIAMLGGFFDETGHSKDEKQRFNGMAGLIAPADHWEQLERK